MRPDAVWSKNGYWEAPRVASCRSVQPEKINLSSCTIIINELGFIDLLQDTIIIKRLKFTEYLEIKNKVLKIERRDLYV